MIGQKHVFIESSINKDNITFYPIHNSFPFIQRFALLTTCIFLTPAGYVARISHPRRDNGTFQMRNGRA